MRGRKSSMGGGGRRSSAAKGIRSSISRSSISGHGHGHGRRESRHGLEDGGSGVDIKGGGTQGHENPQGMKEKPTTFEALVTRTLRYFDNKLNVLALKGKAWELGEETTPILLLEVLRRTVSLDSSLNRDIEESSQAVGGGKAPKSSAGAIAGSDSASSSSSKERKLKKGDAKSDNSSDSRFLPALLLAKRRRSRELRQQRQCALASCGLCEVIVKIVGSQCHDDLVSAALRLAIALLEESGTSGVYSVKYKVTLYSDVLF